MTATTIRVQMAQRKDTAANWTSANPILLSGEIGYETDTKKFKIGNGSSNWNSLAYLPIPDGSGNLTITGNLEIGSTGSLTFEGSTADGFETTLAVTNPTADRTITLPDRSGTVITSGDTGTVTSTMLADGTIVNEDVNAAAAIAGTKISPDFGSQTVQTTGIFSHAIGSAAAPTVTFTGDTNTGLYSPGADQLAISTNSTGRLFVDANGNVSLGTAAATNFANYQTLTLNDTTGAFLEFKVGGTYTHGIVADSSALSIKSIANLPVTFGVNDIERMRLTSTGLGIGTTSPDQPMTLNAANGYPVMSFQNNGTTVGDIGFNVGLGMVLSGRSTNPVLFYTNSSERARIDSSGRLLVGTSTNTGNIWLQESLALVRTGSGYGGASFTSYPGTAAGESAMLNFQRSRGTSDGSYTSVASGDALGFINFKGADGASFVNGARITAEVDGTPGANDMPGRLVFSTTADGASSPTERLRIDSYGSHAMYSTVQVAVLSTNYAASASNTLLYARYGATGVNGGTDCLYIRSNGNIQNTNNSYGAISDIKLKENIVDAGSQWDDLKALQVRKYNFKEGQTHTQIGLVAQEVELVSPGLVTESPDRDAEGNDLGTVTKSVNYSVLYMKAVKALQEAMERIETLEAKVAALESA